MSEQVTDQDLVDLRNLRTAIQRSIANASRTLAWFGDELPRGPGIPLNTWRRMDRPFGRRSQTLGTAFDVWHAMLRAERTLRMSDAASSKDLKVAASRLRKQLEKLTEVTREDPRVQARRIVSDEIFGTFNALSTASVLRAEIFPERFTSTPSYLAGHVLIAELKIAREVANAHGVRPIAERYPRLSVVSQGVHSLMLYVEHLRKRAMLFDKIANELDAADRLAALVDTTIPAAAKHREFVSDGYLRIAMARLASMCSECASLLLATRPFFREWQESLQKRADHHATLAPADLEKSLHEALRRCFSVRRRDDRQLRVFKRSVKFCHMYATQVSNVQVALDNALTIPELATYKELRGPLVRLRRALSELEKTSAAERLRERIRRSGTRPDSSLPGW